MHSSEHLTPGAVRAVIRLLDDENPVVQVSVRAQLEALGQRAVPYLRAALIDAPAPHRALIHAALRDLAYGRVEDEFRRLAALPPDAVDLEAGVFTLAQFGYPQLDLAPYAARLNAMADELGGRIKRRRSGRTIIASMNDYLVGECGFRGNEADYYDPDNSYFNRVLDRQTGIPITLATLYLLLGKRLDLPLFGVAMPGHFIAKYQRGAEELFFDPFYRGRLMSRGECLAVLVRLGFGPMVHHLDPVGPVAILLRMMNNLILVYRDRDETDLAHRLQRLADLLTREEDNA